MTDRTAPRPARDIFWWTLLVFSIGATAVAVALLFAEPPPGNTITIAAASKGSPYHALAERYKAFLARHHVTLNIRETSGSFENIALLGDGASGVDLAFVQGGLAGGRDVAALRSLGRVMFEPLWLFANADARIQHISDLKGRRVLVGPKGGGTNALALRILEIHGITAETATLVTMELPDYVAELEAGRADAGFLVLAPGARTIARLFGSPKVQLVDLAQAAALSERLPYLTALTLKAGIVDFARNLPSSDTHLVATRTALVARTDLHPALANLMTQALVAVHAEPQVDARGEAPIFAAAARFPLSEDPEFAMSDQARQVYRSGPPLLQRVLPFGVATLIDRLRILAIPLIGVLLPLMRLAPLLYTWQVRRRLLRWYRRLKGVEQGIVAGADAALIAGKRAELDAIEEGVNQLVIPLGFTNQLYDLKQHIDVVRRRLIQAERGERLSGSPT